MSQNFDPYQPPSLSNSMPTSPETEDLRNIAFWQNFFSILGFIVTGITALAMVGNIVFSAMSPNPIPRVIGRDNRIHCWTSYGHCRLCDTVRAIKRGSEGKSRLWRTQNRPGRLCASAKKLLALLRHNDLHFDGDLRHVLDTVRIISHLCGGAAIAICFLALDSFFVITFFVRCTI